MASLGNDEDGAVRVGREQVRKGFASLWDNYRDAQFEPVGEDFIAGGAAARRGSSPARTRPPANGSARGGDVYTFRDARIAVKNPMRKQAP